MTNYLQGVDLSTNTATHKYEKDKVYIWRQYGKYHRLDGPWLALQMEEGE